MGKLIDELKIRINKTSEAIHNEVPAISPLCLLLRNQKIIMKSMVEILNQPH